MSLKLMDVVLPALFAVLVSWARLWRAGGVEPVAVAPIRDRVLAELAAIRLRAGPVPFFSTATAEFMNTEALSGFIRQEIVPVDDPAERIAAEIESLTSSCAAAELSPADRSDIAGRLTALLRKLEGKDAGEIDPGGNADTLENADDRELFDFIDHLS
ncbi:hypothetical protein OH799_05320 [Nocardia sp. NBC_00881]|uniref:hypothetical protein n=1 Tax=Nocardia sp. NBC_00881 TaxID=2975995 RepID=UPI00386B598F|nr:hypothetical protein OH799_05320 [Nocardia sp. NBC_00881]